MTARRAVDVHAAIALLAAATGAGRLNLPVVAMGWASVDAERTAGELDRAAPGFGPFDPAADETLLGARCLVGRHGDVRLAILEPVTEGRLAATLARHDEGPAALWLTGPADQLDDTEVRLTTPAAGPFGAERLVLGGPIGGPHLLVVERPAGTIHE